MDCQGLKRIGLRRMQKGEVERTPRPCLRTYKGCPYKLLIRGESID